MKRILSTLTLLLCFAFTAVNAQDNYNATTMGAIVKYYETAKWGQQSPFNDQIYTESGGSTHGAAGCVPTAYAIIMRYWGFPTEGTSSDLRHCQTNESITDRTYDWSKMPLTNGNGWTDEQRNEVSKLFAHVLHAVFPASIGSSYTDANEGGSTSYLETHFGYTNISSSQQWQHTKDAWEAKMKESLDNGCPIPYASKNTGTGDARHMFVIDGYTTEGYYHINFGWNGYANGWHKLDEIKPADSNGNLTGDNYSWVGDATSTSAHKAFFNLAPKTEKFTVTATANPSNMGTVSINGGTAGTTASAEINENFTATLTATANSGYTFSHWSKGGVQVSTEKTYKALVAAEGNAYVANFLAVGNSTVNVSVTYNSSYGTVTYNSNAVSGTGITPYQNSEVTLVATPLDGYVFNGWTVTKGANTTNYAGNELTFVATGDMSVEANFSLAVVEYKINNENVTVSGSSTSARNSTWTYNTTIANPAPIQLKSSNGSTEVYGLSNTNPRLYAYVYDATDKGYNSVTYTLSVPEGYLITDYRITYYVPSSYSGQITVTNGATTATPTNTDDQYLLYPGATRSLNGTRSTEFTLTTSQTGQQYIEIVDFSVSVMSEGSEGGSSTPTPEPDPEPEPTPTTYTVTTTANPAAGGTAKFAVGTGSAKTQGDVENGTQITLYATANAGYNFVNWTLNGAAVSTDATCNVSVSQASSYVANFEATQQGGEETPLPEPEYPEPTGATYTNNYLTSATTTGAIENVTYSANAHPGDKVVTLPGTVRVEKGGSFTLNLVAKSLSSSTSSVAEDMRYCHASLFTDFDCDGSFGIATQTWGNQPPTNNVAGNYSSVMNITHTITVPADAPLGTSHVRMVYTNAWKGWPTNGTAELDKGIVYDFVVEVVETVTITASASVGGTVKINNEAIETKNVVKGSEVTLVATPQNGYEFVNWTKGGAEVSTEATYTFTAAETASYVANFQALPQTDPLAGKYFRLKVKNTSNYMNIANTNNNDGSTSGVTVVAKNESSDTQVFLFEQSGDGYKLKANSGNYIKCHAWNANANTTSANDATVLTFEPTANELEYLIKWDNTNLNNGVERDDYFKAENGYVYCDAAIGSATTWVLEEVIPSNEKTLNVTFADVTYTNYAGNTINSGWGYKAVVNTTPAVTFQVDGITNNNLGWTTKVNGNKTPYLAKSTNFTISIPEPYKITGYRMTVKGESSAFSGDVTYTATGNNTGTIAISGTTEGSFSATDLNTNTINIGVGGTAGTGIFITALEITYIENEFTPLPFKAEVENWRDNNPNTHLGTITIGGTPLKLTPEHRTASELTMPLGEGTTLAFTRKYRGFEFQGFYIGATSLGTNPTLEADQVNAINDETPLVAKFTATDDVTLFYDDDTYSYRIPAIAKTGTNRLVAISDYRHNLDDIGRDKHGTGKLRVDLVMRTSDNNGATWSDIKTIAAGDDSKVGSYLRAFGDAAVAAVGENIVVMAAAGDVMYSSNGASATNTNKMVRVFSSDNGASWTITDMTTKMYSTATSLFPDHFCAFFGSGKLAVDYNFNGTGNARIYGALLMRNSSSLYNNFVVYSDDLGENWSILGGSTSSIASDDEPKVEILPNGQILLSVRRGGGRKFRVFTYGTGADDKANGVGSWGDAAVNGCDNGGSNATNGEIICLDAKKPNGKPTKILLQSQPKGGNGTYERYNVTIWYKEVSADETYTPSSIASGWTQGLEVSPAGVKSAYSAMCLQENGEIAFFFEEAPCYADNHEKGYSMVYVPLTIEEITNNNFLNPNADIEYVPVEFNIELTDAEGNIYRETLDYVPDDVAAALTAKYPFITLGENGVVTGSDNAYTYTNTVTLPFKVSNAETTVWYNIYWPSYNPVSGSGKTGCPVYLSATEGNLNVPKVTADAFYGESDYNTLDWAERLSWAVYNVNNSFTFKFKNKSADKYIQVTSVASGNTQNTVYVDEDNATAFTLLKDTGTRNGDYALAAKVGDTEGYLCSTSATYDWATHFVHTNHEGAWAKFAEAPDYQAIVDALTENVAKFGAGDGNYTDNNDINAIKAIIENIATTPLNTLNTHTETVQTVKESYREIVLTVNDDETETVPGRVSITVNGSEAETVNNKFVPANATVSILATANPGYRFVNWTRPAAQASAAARTAAARSGEFVSDANPYTVTVSEAVSLEANFEEIVVTATLTDGQGNQYIVELDGFTNGITKETVAAKLVEKYPYITLGTADGGITLEGGDAAYTYTNTVELPFKVSNTSYIWHNIYWPSNTRAYDYPIYWAASSAEDTYVPKVTGDYAYGAHPTYNTKAGNDKISWAIYNVNNSFEFIFKNKVTQKYIKVTSVANGDAQNVVYVENAEDATAFTIEKKPAGNDYYTPAQYALAAKVGETTGYLCSTSATGYHYATHYNSNGHQGAWIEFVESPDYYSKIMDMGTVLGMKFSAGDGKCIITPSIQEVIDEMQNSGSITLNALTEYSSRMEDAMNEWPAVSVTINPNDGGTTSINGEENVVHKYVPNNYELALVATPAEGYHFDKWVDGTNEITTAEYTKTISGGKGDVIALTANFAKNSYTISVSAGEGGSAMIGTETSATVNHGDEVTLTAQANDGYEFAGWYNGDVLVSNEANYTFTATSDINYTARFNETVVTPTKYAIHIVTVDANGNPLANNATGPVKAVINIGGRDWVTDEDFGNGATADLVATSDFNQSAYLFDGWYKNDELVDKAPEITVTVTEGATYEARFIKGYVVTLASDNKSWGYPNMITYPDGSPVVGAATELKAVVKPNEEVLISINPNYGFRVANWTDKDGNEVAGKNANSFILEITGDNKYTANLEKATYTLSVSTQQGTMGEVSAKFMENSGTSVVVGHNIEATITASPYIGYRFVEWTTTDGTHVSDKKTYTVLAIENVEDMDDVEYVAVFEEIGTYCRIAYNFEVPVAAKSAATRAAGEETITISPATGDVASSVYSSVWNYNVDNNPAGLKIVATDSESNRVTAITASTGNPSKLRFYAGHNFEGTSDKSSAPTTFTLSVNENYVITGYSLRYIVSSANKVTISNEYGYNETPTTRTYQTMEKTDISVQSITFNVSAASPPSSYYAQADVFTVTIQQVGGETPEPETETVKYYVQSEACGVSGKENALKMTTVNDKASSIFYYADNKLMSYAKGTYVNENGGTRGLQGVDATVGDVTFESNKIKFTNGANGTNVAYMHAKESNGIYYVDNCGATAACGNDDHNFIIEAVTSLPVTITDAGYASWYAPVAVELPANVEAWYFEGKIGYKGEDKYAIMTKINGDVVPANTGVILGGPAGDYELIITETETETETEIEGNLLKGTVAATYVKGDAYVLSKPGGKEIGFYLAELNKQNDTAWKNNSHKAYLPKGDWYDEAQPSAGFRFSFGDDNTTPIEEMETESSEVKGIYDLTGRKLEGISGTGIYIINGKKVLIK